jgi:hypothetical protein
MDSCITQDLKVALIKMIDNKRPYEILKVFAEDFMPVCAEPAAVTAGTVHAAGEAAKRSMPSAESQWGPTTYYDEKGEKHDYTSPSKAFEELFNVSPSVGIECEIVKGEAKCIPKTMVMSFMSRGMIVRGDHEPPPVITHDMSERDRVTLHQAWNQRLKASGKHFTVYHPKSPQAMKLDEAVAPAKPAKPAKGGNK